jgi:hypothetical protein
VIRLCTKALRPILAPTSFATTGERQALIAVCRAAFVMHKAFIEGEAFIKGEVFNKYEAFNNHEAFIAIQAFIGSEARWVVASRKSSVPFVKGASA